MAPPLSTPSVGGTFLFAMVLLGIVAVGQMGAIVWRIGHNAPFEGSSPKTIVTAPQTPAAALSKLAPAKTLVPAETNPALIEAERRLIASLPRPTPVAVRRIITPEVRVNDLVNLARTLRDRGDTSTALTRLREAQVISQNNWQIASEIAITYEKMGLFEKAIQQWRRIYEMGERAGIYYAAAEAKLQALQLPSDTQSSAPQAPLLPPDSAGSGSGKILSLGRVGTVDDTGNSQPLRRLKLRVPIFAQAGARVDVRDAMIQVHFYEQLKNGSIVQTNANVAPSWASSPVDWSTPNDPEVLEVEYAQPEPEPGTPRTEQRIYFGYVVRVYYKNTLNAVFSDPVKLLKQFPPPENLPLPDTAPSPISDLPQ